MRTVRDQIGETPVETCLVSVAEFADALSDKNLNLDRIKTARPFLPWADVAEEGRVGAASTEAVVVSAVAEVLGRGVLGHCLAGLSNKKDLPCEVMGKTWGVRDWSGGHRSRFSLETQKVALLMWSSNKRERWGQFVDFCERVSAASAAKTRSLNPAGLWDHGQGL